MLEFKPGLFIAQVVTFLIAVFLLWKIAWGPLYEILEKRKEKIKKDLEIIEQTKNSLKKMEQEYKLRFDAINFEVREGEVEDYCP